MKFRSTRNVSSIVSLSEAIEQGLASDGGLFVPEFWPTFDLKSDLLNKKLDDLNLAEFAFEILKPFFRNDSLEPFLMEICSQTFNFPLPLKSIDAQACVLELFHGPTLAFKDFGARFLALCLEKIQTLNQKPKLILVATSGDTGGAVAAAFNEFTKIPVAILYPQNKISERQEKQLTCWGPQVHAFAVKGTFDDCQKMAKEAFQSVWWKSRFQLISANSINLARLLPQMIYFAYASLQYQKNNKKNAGLIIPSGNMGNATAALWAHKIGFPIEKIIFSHNANQTVLDYFQTEKWNIRPSVSTLANAMDVGNPSNFERIHDLYPELAELKKLAEVYSVNDEQISKIISDEKTIFCPHTATAVFVRNYKVSGNWIIVATAHPAKFDTIVEPLIHKKIEIPGELEKIISKKSTFTEINPLISELESYFKE